MSRIILLPGNSAGNRQAIDEIQKIIGGEVLYYSHWDTGESMINFETEVQRLVELANGEPIRVLAKSAGTILAMKAVREAGVRINSAVFLGTAVNWGIERGIPVKEWLQHWEVPTLFVQNEHDPVISSTDLATLLSNKHAMLVLPGGTHDYNELDQYIPRAREILM